MIEWNINLQEIMLSVRKKNCSFGSANIWVGQISSKPEALPDNKIMPTLNKGPGYHSPG
jgi:hypothetical protein